MYSARTKKEGRPAFGFRNGPAVSQIRAWSDNVNLLTTGTWFDVALSLHSILVRGLLESVVIFKDWLVGLYRWSPGSSTDDHIAASSHSIGLMIYSANFCFHILKKSRVLFLWRCRHLVCVECVQLFGYLTVVISKRRSLTLQRNITF